jgi:hypothetical protein
MGKAVGIVFVLLALGVGAWLLFGAGGGDAPEPFVEISGAADVAADVERRDAVVGTAERAAAPDARAEEVEAVPGSEGGAGSGEPTIVVVATWEGSTTPVDGLAVHTFRAGSGPWAPRVAGRTDARGEARMTGLEPGAYVVRAALGARQADVEVAPGETVRVRFAIARGVTLRGQVVGANGLPIPGATVWLSEPWDDARGVVVATAGVDGSFVIEGAHRGQSVGASAPGFAASPVVPVQTEAGKRDVRLVLTNAMGTVRGLVRDAQGAPVGGARVLLGRPDRPFDRRGVDGARLRGPAPQLVESDAEGRFVAEHLESGVTRLEADAPGHGPFLGEVAVMAGGGVDVVVTLPEAAAVVGVCSTRSGSPLTGVEVRTDDGLFLGARTAVSGTDGAYRLGDVAAGQITLVALRAQGGEPLRGEILAVADQVARWDPVFAASTDQAASLSVRGRVVDLRSQPLAGYRIVAEALPRGSGANAVATVAADGSFAVEASSTQVRLLVFGPGGFTGFPIAVLDGVARGRDGVEIRVDAFALSGLRGRIVDSSGQPVPATIQVWHDDARVFREVVVDPTSGRFAFEPAPPGTCTVEIRSESHPWQRRDGLRLAPGSVTDLGDIVLAAGGRIEGTVTFEDGGAPTALQLRFVDERVGREVGVATVDGGRFRTNPLPLAALTLVVEGEGIAAARLPVPLDAAQPYRVVDLRVTRGVPVTLRVELPPGFARPERLALGVLRDREVVWTRGLGASAGLEVQLSLAPGSYRALLRSDSPLADVTFELGATGKTVVLRPTPR